MKLLNVGLLCHLCWRLFAFAASNADSSGVFWSALGSQMAITFLAAASTYHLSHLDNGSFLSKVLVAGFGVSVAQGSSWLDDTVKNW